MGDPKTVPYIVGSLLSGSRKKVPLIVGNSHIRVVGFLLPLKGTLTIAPLKGTLTDSYYSTPEKNPPSGQKK